MSLVLCVCPGRCASEAGCSGIGQVRQARWSEAWQRSKAGWVDVAAVRVTRGSNSRSPLTRPFTAQKPTHRGHPSNFPPLQPVCSLCGRESQGELQFRSPCSVVMARLMAGSVGTWGDGMAAMVLGTADTHDAADCNQ
ncbi:hypothetical protein E2C01_004163 [Portunus trituberculatus]|uniref:Uncharacterized protein n=1 Tax=Portunus trituberculatus TaxID=210409 RepID=A0A5B7CTA2_PORTR|nr:hypothetical protein [Portunus trituberculatus]